MRAMMDLWREGDDYPSDDDVYEYDIMEEADRAYEYENDI